MTAIFFLLLYGFIFVSCLWRYHATRKPEWGYAAFFGLALFVVVIVAVVS